MHIFLDIRSWRCIVFASGGTGRYCWCYNFVVVVACLFVWFCSVFSFFPFFFFFFFFFWPLFFFSCPFFLFFSSFFLSSSSSSSSSPFFFFLFSFFYVQFDLCRDWIEPFQSWSISQFNFLLLCRVWSKQNKQKSKEIKKQMNRSAFSESCMINKQTDR